MSEGALRVLVIEDDPDDVLLLREALAAAGPGEFAIHWAPNLAEGLERLRAHPVDALLVDLGLPDSQGIATLEAIQERAPQLPVVVITGLDDEDLAMEAVHRGAQDYLVKGQVSGDLVVRALRYAVEREGAEQRILHLNAVLRAIRGVNQLIGRERDRQELIQGVCDELAAVTGYLSAWIMIFGQHKGAPLLARAGGEAPDADAASAVPLCLPDCMADPSAALFRDGRECGDCRQCALRPGLSAVVVRLEYGARVFGAVAVVMADALAHGPEEVALVREVADDTAYALHGLDNEAKRQQAETALRQSERKFRAIFDHAGDPILIYDLSGQLLEVNHIACERLGYGYNELLGMRFTQLCMPDTAMGFEASVQRLRQRGHDSAEASFKRRSGVPLPVELSSSLIRYNGQAAALTSARDITMRKRAEEAQRLAAVGQLAAGVAHEFNNVLAGMSARAQVARTLQSAEAWEQLGESVVRLTARGAEIGKNLISFARPGQPQKAALRLEEQVEMALAVAARELENSGITVVRDYLTQPRLVLADAGQIQQVLLNVILNACHAMPEGGVLTISTRFEPLPCRAGEMVVAISDTGVGIAPEHLPHVFEPFFTTKGSYGESQRAGAGLGLSVSQGLINAHGGTITLDSAQGRGAICTVRLGVYEGTLEAAPTAPVLVPVLADPVRGEGLVLLAEDEEDIRAPVALALSQSGFEVIEVGSLPAAMQVVSRRRLKAVVSDLMMPGGDGRRILDLTRHMLCPPVVIFMTGKSEENLVQTLTDGGAALVLGKPVEVNEVVNAVLRLTS